MNFSQLKKEICDEIESILARYWNNPRLPSTFIRATVPSGATPGTVSVVTPTGALSSNPQFVVTK